MLSYPLLLPLFNIRGGPGEAGGRGSGGRGSGRRGSGRRGSGRRGSGGMSKNESFDDVRVVEGFGSVVWGGECKALPGDAVNLGDGGMGRLYPFAHPLLQELLLHLAILQLHQQLHMFRLHEGGRDLPQQRSLTLVQTAPQLGRQDRLIGSREQLRLLLRLGAWFASGVQLRFADGLRDVVAGGGGRGGAVSVAGWLRDGVERLRGMFWELRLALCFEIGKQGRLLGILLGLLRFLPIGTPRLLWGPIHCRFAQTALLFPRVLWDDGHGSAAGVGIERRQFFKDEFAGFVRLLGLLVPVGLLLLLSLAGGLPVAPLRPSLRLVGLLVVQLEPAFVSFLSYLYPHCVAYLSLTAPLLPPLLPLPLLPSPLLPSPLLSSPLLLLALLLELPHLQMLVEFGHELRSGSGSGEGVGPEVCALEVVLGGELDHLESPLYSDVGVDVRLQFALLHCICNLTLPTQTGDDHSSKKIWLSRNSLLKVSDASSSTALTSRTGFGSRGGRSSSSLEQS